MEKFVQEARRKDGKEYPPASLHGIVSSIQRFLRENGQPEVIFSINKMSPEEELRCQNGKSYKPWNQYKEKTSTTHHPRIESILWDKGTHAFQCTLHAHVHTHTHTQAFSAETQLKAFKTSLNLLVCFKNVWSQSG